MRHTAWVCSQQGTVKVKGDCCWEVGVPAALRLTAHCGCSFLFNNSLQYFRLIQWQLPCSVDAFLMNDSGEYKPNDKNAAFLDIINVSSCFTSHSEIDGDLADNYLDKNLLLHFLNLGLASLLLSQNVASLVAYPVKQRWMFDCLAETQCLRNFLPSFHLFLFTS